MNKKIKVTLDLESRQAENAADKLEGKLNRIIKESSAPHKINLFSGLNNELKNLNRINALLGEIKKAGGANISYAGGEAKESRGINDAGSVSGNQARITSIEKKYSQQRKKIASDENRFKLESFKTMLYAEEELLGGQAELYKTISAAEAAMSAYNAANAALLPPPVGAGPIIGEIQAAIVLMNGLKRVEKITASQIPGYAKGGIVIGEKGPEVIENMQDYASGKAELINKTISAVQKEFIPWSGSSSDVVKEIKNLRSEISKILNRPAVAYLNDNEAKKVYYRGSYIARKLR